MASLGEAAATVRREDLSCFHAALAQSERDCAVVAVSPSGPGLLPSVVGWAPPFPIPATELGLCDLRHGLIRSNFSLPFTALFQPAAH